MHHKNLLKNYLQIVLSKKFRFSFDFQKLIHKIIPLE